MKNKKKWREVDGQLVHDGDCRIYSLSEICTCGLLHFLDPFDIKDAEKNCRNYKSDLRKHINSLFKLEDIALGRTKNAKER